MQKTILPFLLLLHAQTYNTKSGYLITNQGDTLRGLFRDRADLTESVDFKREIATDFQNYTPATITAFYIGADYYEAKEIDTQKIFLQVLAKGNLNLYQTSSERVFYIQKANGVLRKLEKKDSVIENRVKYDFRYRNVLNAFTSDCPTLKRSVDRVSFSNRELQRIVEEYNNCVNPNGSAKVFKPSSKLKIQAGAKAGWISNTMRFVTESNVFMGNNASVESTFSGGIFARLSFKDTWALQPEVLLTPKSGMVDARTVFGTGDINVFSFTYLQVPLSIYYTLPTNKIRPFVFVGGLVGLPLKTEAYRLRDEMQLPLTFELDEDELGYRGGAGVQWSFTSKMALQLEYLYEATAANRLSPVNKIGITSHSVKIGVLF